MTVQIRLPRLLRPVVGDRRRIEVDGATVGGAIASLLETEPGLRPHLFDESGALRPHILCFVDGASTRLDDRDAALEPGVTIEFLQAVSGGACGCRLGVSTGRDIVSRVR